MGSRGDFALIAIVLAAWPFSRPERLSASARPRSPPRKKHHPTGTQHHSSGKGNHRLLEQGNPDLRPAARRPPHDRHHDRHHDRRHHNTTTLRPDHHGCHHDRRQDRIHDGRPDPVHDRHVRTRGRGTRNNHESEVEAGVNLDSGLPSTWAPVEGPRRALGPDLRHLASSNRNRASSRATG